MLAIQSLRAAALELLGADSATLNPGVGSECKIALVQNDIAPSELITLADCTLANFGGSTPIALGAGAQLVLLDPGTTDAVMDLRLPAGGFRWETTGLLNLPQTIYGFVLLDDGLSVVYASERFDSPVTLTAANQRVDIGAPTMRLAANSIT